MKAALLLSLSLVACGPRAEDVPLVRADHCPVGGCTDAGPSADGGPVTIPDEPKEPWDETGAGPLTGIFVVETTITAFVAVPIETRQLFRLRIVQKGKEIRQKTTLCAFKLPSLEGIAELSIPPELQALMETKTVEAEGPFLASDAVLASGYAPPPSVIVVGADLASPTDPLPTIEEPAAAIDEDADGNPGVTILAKAVTCKNPEALFVALRTTSSLEGKVKNFDRIEGLAQVNLDQKVLGYSDDCLSVAAKLNIQIDPDSPFVAKRAAVEDDIDENGNVSCSEIRLRAPALFGDFWAP